MLIALLIFIVTIVLVIWQPKGLGVGWSASLGAMLALLSGVVSLGDIPVVWNIVWNATATFIRQQPQVICLHHLVGSRSVSAVRQ
ncbi:hypothetical protein AO354_36665 [Pseudomonas syringae pv. syringae]|nr:hypothetical protein AO354_36665 [Pseudomonas syringae pv. syringae]